VFENVESGHGMTADLPSMVRRRGKRDTESVRCAVGESRKLLGGLNALRVGAAHDSAIWQG
jgi:hypothetical protein